MLVRITRVGFFAAIALALSAAPADAFGRRSSGGQACYPVYCYPTPCYPICPCSVIPHCCVYTPSEPVEPLNGPYHTLVRGASLGNGVIVQVDVSSGTASQPLDVFVVTARGTGDFRYEGWNKKELSPGTPGGTVRYSFFLCPTRAGATTVDVDFVMSDKKVVTVPFSFNIK